MSEKDPEKRRIKKINLTVNGKTHEVPEKYFRDLRHPQIRTAQFCAETSMLAWDEPPEIYLTFKLYEFDDEGKRKYEKDVTIYFIYGKITRYDEVNRELRRLDARKMTLEEYLRKYEELKGKRP